MNTYVLVHGAWASKFVWDEIKLKLEKNGHKVIAPDLPGHGDDQTPVADITMQTYADAIANVVKQQDSPIILAGHSMGGMVISQVAEMNPGNIAKLVYISAYLPASGQDLQALSGTDAGSNRA